jgi:predicted DNA-binding ribbon-helix-helix protein
MARPAPQKPHREGGVIKRSVRIAGHATSVSLEQPFWDILNRMAHDESLSLNTLIARIDQTRSTNLSSALRLAVLEYLQRSKPSRTP